MEIFSTSNLLMMSLLLNVVLFILVVTILPGKKKKEIEVIPELNAVSRWFRAKKDRKNDAYLVIPRSILQSATAWWQTVFVQHLSELTEEVGDWESECDDYVVKRRGENSGRWMKDPLKDYTKRVTFTPNKED